MLTAWGTAFFVGCLSALVWSIEADPAVAAADGTVVWDAAVRVPSPQEKSSWFPDLTVDYRGRVHVVWCETNHLAMNYSETPGNRKPGPPEHEELYYSMWNGEYWSAAKSIAAPQMAIYRNAIAVDRDDILHLLFNRSVGSDTWTYYIHAPAGEGFPGDAGARARPVGAAAKAYASDIAASQQTLHVVYDAAGANQGDCPACADIYYRRSTDSGDTWSDPLDLRPSPTGASRAQLKVDSDGIVHVAWDEGWDRVSGRGAPQYGVYMASRDEGRTWSAPTLVSYPESTNAQLTVGSSAPGGVMLAWRTTSPQHRSIYYMWSTDGGESWSIPQAVPGIVAKRWGSPFDAYDMATDSGRHIHLLVTGYLSTDGSTGEQGPPNLYHLEWDGRNWSAASPVYTGGWYPEYPHVVIERGNQLHVAWFVHAAEYGEITPHQVWYAHGQAGSPAAGPPPVASATSYGCPGSWPSLLLIGGVVTAALVTVGVRVYRRSGWFD